MLQAARLHHLLVVAFALCHCSLVYGDEFANGTCGMNKVADCINDMGSCGNACCTLEFESSLSPEDTFTAIKEYLSGSGSDGLFKLVDAKDLRSFHIPDGYEFILQGTHTTYKARYVDTLDFNIRTSDSGSLVRAFSISDVAGALGDAGQNHRTLSIVGSDLQFSGKTIVHGCGSGPTDVVQ
mmetsp:Transcript_59054/g.141043  ORF Transcript_59054/g.141043 Transcript_59054/m.141043 type:complete len:182 (+) Transcript_59054:64-609(+)